VVAILKDISSCHFLQAGKASCSQCVVKARDGPDRPLRFNVHTYKKLDPQNILLSIIFILVTRNWKHHQLFRTMPRWQALRIGIYGCSNWRRITNPLRSKKFSLICVMATWLTTLPIKFQRPTTLKYSYDLGRVGVWDIRWWLCNMAAMFAFWFYKVGILSLKSENRVETVIGAERYVVAKSGWHIRNYDAQANQSMRNLKGSWCSLWYGWLNISAIQHLVVDAPN